MKVQTEPLSEDFNVWFMVNNWSKQTILTEPHLLREVLPEWNLPTPPVDVAFSHTLHCTSFFDRGRIFSSLGTNLWIELLSFNLFNKSITVYIFPLLLLTIQVNLTNIFGIVCTQNSILLTEKVYFEIPSAFHFPSMFVIHNEFWYKLSWGLEDLFRRPFHCSIGKIFAIVEIKTPGRS